MDAAQLRWGQPRTDVDRETLGTFDPSRQQQGTSSEWEKSRKQNSHPQAEQEIPF